MGEISPPTAADYAQAEADRANNRIKEMQRVTIPDLTLRDYFAAQAPVDVKTVLAVWGDPSLAGAPSDDESRAAFVAVWAMLRYEYADAMMKARKR